MLKLLIMTYIQRRLKWQRPNFCDFKSKKPEDSSPIILVNTLLSNSENKDDFRGAYDKFPDFFRMGTFIDSTHMKLKSPSK